MSEFKKEVKKYFNKYFKAQYFNENDDEFKSLLRLLNKSGKSAEKFKSDLQATKKELEEKERLAISRLKDIKELESDLKKAQAERDELSRLAIELLKADGKSYIGAFNNLAEAVGLKSQMI